MCGITGYLWQPGAGPDPVPAIAAMMETIAHRGPDSRGHWVDPEAGVLRLSFVHYTTRAEVDRLIAALDRTL